MLLYIIVAEVLAVFIDAVTRIRVVRSETIKLEQ